MNENKNTTPTGPDNLGRNMRAAPLRSIRFQNSYNTTHQVDPKKSREDRETKTTRDQVQASRDPDQASNNHGKTPNDHLQARECADHVPKEHGRPTRDNNKAHNDKQKPNDHVQATRGNGQNIHPTDSNLSDNKSVGDENTYMKTRILMKMNTPDGLGDDHGQGLADKYALVDVSMKVDTL